MSWCRAQHRGPDAPAAVLSRESPSAYRVRGTFRQDRQRETTISWLGVFDGDDRRALRITGEETARTAPRRLVVGRRRDAAADRHSSMDELSPFDIVRCRARPPDSGPRLLWPERRIPRRSGGIFAFSSQGRSGPADSPSPVAAGPVPVRRRGRRWPPLSRPDRLALASANAESVHFITLSKLRDNGLDSYCEPSRLVMTCAPHA